MTAVNIKTDGNKLFVIETFKNNMLSVELPTFFLSLKVWYY